MLDYKYSQQRGSLQEAAQSPTLTTIDFNAIPRNVIELVPASVAQHECVIPLRSEGEVLVLATDRPRDIGLRDKLTFLVNRKIILTFAPREQIVAAIDRYYGNVECLADDYEECAESEIAAAKHRRKSTESIASLLCEPARYLGKSLVEFKQGMHGGDMDQLIEGAPGEDTTQGIGDSGMF